MLKWKTNCCVLYKLVSAITGILMFVKCEIESSVDWVEEISLGNQLSCFGIQVSEWPRFLISGE